MAQDLLPGAPHAPPANAWRWYVTWPILLALAWAVYEWTSDPAGAAASLCLKFGQEDYHTAWWLWRRDRSRRRGAAHGLLYLSWGLWKATLAGTFVLLTVRVPQELHWEAIRPTLRTAALCCAGAAVLTLSAILLARFGRVRLWLHPDVHRARFSDRWPPSSGDPASTNRARYLVIAALVLLVVPAALLVILPLVMLLPARGSGAAASGSPRADVVIVVSLLGVCGAAALWGLDRLRDRLLASSPVECWGIASELTGRTESVPEEHVQQVKREV